MDDDRITVRVGRWAELGTVASALRRAVFVEEQGVPLDMEWDGEDEGALHAVAFDAAGTPLATGRLLAQAPGVARIGRMAVDRAARGRGLGRKVLDALLDAARAQGFREALLHAQCTVRGFYAAAGFTEHGPVFEEAGIEHVEMVRAL